MHNPITYEVFITVILSVISIILGLIYFLFKNFGNEYRLLANQISEKDKQYIDKKVEVINEDLVEFKDNYLCRFEEIKDIIANFRLDTEKRLAKIDSKIESLTNKL